MLFRNPVLYLVLCVSVFSGIINILHAATHSIVPGTNAIQNAITKSRPGDTLIIHSGTYREENLKITHPLVIIGKGWPVIDGQHKVEMMSISAHYTTVKSIRFINSGKSNSDDLAAIKLYSVKHVTIQDNEFDNNFFCIYLLNSDSCFISGNDIKGYAVNEQSSGNGIHLWKCGNAVIKNNKVSGHRDGIYFEFVTDSQIEGNTSYSNIRYGLHFMFSNRNVYSNNRFNHNGAGVAVMYSKNIEMRGNTFDLNRGSAAYGLLLKDITDSRIFGNRFEHNSIAIYMEGSNRIVVTSNRFHNNGRAVRILSNCEVNEIVRNNFTGNSFDVSTNGPAESNTFSQNYWDKYEGYDLNRDQTGDIPYRPVSLYAMLMERIPFALILYRSFVVTIFERVEKIAPAIIPVNLYDDSPRMKPWKL
jgi:nitrous oxidase accessory protein